MLGLERWLSDQEHLLVSFFFLRFTFIILNYISMYVCAGMYVHVCAGAHGGRGIRSPVAGVTDTHEPCDTGAGNH